MPVGLILPWLGLIILAGWPLSLSGGDHLATDLVLHPGFFRV